MSKRTAAAKVTELKEPASVQKMTEPRDLAEAAAMASGLIDLIGGPRAKQIGEWWERQQTIRFWDQIYSQEYTVARAQIGPESKIDMLQAGAVKVANHAVEQRRAALAAIFAPKEPPAETETKPAV